VSDTSEDRGPPHGWRPKIGERVELQLSGGVTVRGEVVRLWEQPHHSGPPLIGYGVLADGLEWYCQRNSLRPSEGV
jgi:hypothetical protein